MTYDAFSVESEEADKAGTRKVQGDNFPFGQKGEAFFLFVCHSLIFINVLEYITTSTKTLIAEDRQRNHEDYKKRSDATKGKRIHNPNRNEAKQMGK